MSQTSLRLYDREIESLIDRGQIDEAIAHCKHILKIYPKHIDTYRLLGKCYLESQRYIEAADILQRVLTVYPDDFISHIGMSIICEDENDLDKAIWHMDRSLEVQPSNSAVNSELRRLLTLKEGAEPSKVHLSQGAYIRMCVKSGLHEQAIAEAKSALAKEPQRVDLEVILAKMYSELDQKPQAIDQLTIILNKIPFCYEANLLMSQILLSTNRTEEAKTYQQRLIAIDPYFEFISSQFPAPDLVPDDSVLIEKIEWQDSDDDTQRHTKILGVDWQDAKGPLASSGVTTKSFNQDSLPAELEDEDMIPSIESIVIDGLQADVIKTTPSIENEEITRDISEARSESAEPSVEESVQEPAKAETLQSPSPETKKTMEESNEQSKEEIPDWMQAAGWVSTTGDVEEQPASEEILPTGPAQSAEIPDWIKNMAPPEAETSQEGLADESEKLELLDKILPQNEISVESTDVMVDDLQQVVQMPTLPKDDEINIPENEISFDSLRLGSVPSAEVSPEEETLIPGSQEDVPNWLKSGEVPVESPTPSTDEKGDEAILPVWMSVGDELEQEKLEFPDQKSLASAAEQGPEFTEQIPAGEALPDWLSSSPNNEPENDLESQNIQHSDQTPLESLQPTDFFQEANQPTETVPDWLQQDPVSQGNYSPSEDEIIPEWLKDEQPSSPEKIDQENNQVPDITISSPSTYPGDAEFLPEGVTEAEIPDWLKEVNTEQGSGLTMSDEDILPEWAKPTAVSDSEPVISAETAFESFIETAVIPEEIVAEAPDLTDKVSLEPSLESNQESNEKLSQTPLEEKGLDSLLDQLSQGGYSYTPLPQIEDAVRIPSDSMDVISEPLPENNIVEDSPFLDEVLEIDKEIRGDETLVSKPFLDFEKESSETISSSLNETGEEIKESPFVVESGSAVESTENIQTFDSDLGQILPPTELGPQEISDIPMIDQGIPDDTLDVTSDIDIESWLNSLSDVNPDQVPSALGELSEISEVNTPSEETLPPAITKEEDFSLPQLVLVDTAPLASFKEEQVNSKVASPLDELEEAGLFRGISPVQETIGMLAGEESVETPPLSTEKIETVGPETFEEPKIPQTYEELIDSANSSLMEGNLDDAVEVYCKLIKTGTNLDETIQSLRSAVYRYPAEVSIWQTLGDGYARNNRLQEALDAYTKAEELLI
jgi:tetratricopeptide (TPR) repeat protein